MSKKISKSVFSLSILFAVLLSACGNEGEIDSVSLRGKIDGEDWTMKFGKAEAEDIDPGYFALFLPIETVENNPCDIFLPNTNYIAATLPRTEGTYSLPFPIANQFAFRYNGKFLLPTSGSITIKTIGGNSIRGTINARADDDNYIDGDFILNLCQVN
uniref:hypothetical protein n=1 Tax=Fulvivirga sp. TaxID=1931237 RepID=UPI004049F6E0